MVVFIGGAVIIFLCLDMKWQAKLNVKSNNEYQELSNIILFVLYISFPYLIRKMPKIKDRSEIYEPIY
jgi:phosphate starvation-inducible membrane PsiE